MTQVAGLVLAAGLGRRMGQPKAEIIVDGSRLIDRSLGSLRSAGCDPVVAVVGTGVAADAVLVRNRSPEQGLRSSLASGLDAVGSDVDAVALILVDMPGITADAIAAVIAAWQPDRVATGIVDGRRTHPTVMSPSMWRQACSLAEPDEGARRYLTLNADLIDEIPIAINPADLDTPADLAAWTKSRSHSS